MGGTRLTLLTASAQAETNTPTVKSITLPTCSTEYLFPLIAPAIIVVTDPNDLKIICTGTEMLKAKAQLFNMLTAKNMKAIKAHLDRGTERVFSSPLLGDDLLEEKRDD